MSGKIVLTRTDVNKGWIGTLAFSPSLPTLDGSYRLASGGGDGIIRLWDVETGQTLQIDVMPSSQARKEKEPVG